ncbi:SIS domain-containing protein [Lederbergia sp. NSJ-179]|uniref:SIS domain-containing protein n=1 Tax=Lederbergia sp. NSJ-179 TaxID=2931402 RepID=UPI001FD3EE5C|nr:SIS domain-containing protein [Lederbergia sp. NSJ-179]MCJ7841542.1 SIS domain-containing protein [Lederbergia sp. NSJ-179]
MNKVKSEQTHTRREIEQQPDLWIKVIKQFSEEKDRMEQFFKTLAEKHQDARVVFSGAGTSAFIGETIYPYVRRAIRNKGWDVEAISTTNLTATPHLFLDKEIPTILVSFARSGNSPESIAAVELTEKLVDEFYEITITCNQEGALAKRQQGEDRQLVLILPEEANDKGLAMTSSYSTMVLTALYLFSENKAGFEQAISDISAAGKEMLDICTGMIPSLVEENTSRVVYLGSGVFEGLSRESSLKFLELTAGRFPTMFDTSLGFRHGPKSILSANTMVVVYLSNHPYTRKYDLDMLKEIYATEERGKIVAISGIEDSDVEKYSDYQITLPLSEKEDVDLVLPYVIFAQSFAYEKSLHSGISPDNPSPTGVISRVVEGVKIYPFEGEK